MATPVSPPLGRYGDPCFGAAKRCRAPKFCLCCRQGNGTPFGSSLNSVSGRLCETYLFTPLACVKLFIYPLGLTLKCMRRVSSAGSAPHSGARVVHRGAALAAPKKNARGGRTLWGLDTAVSQGWGAPLHTCFGGGGRKSISWFTRKLKGGEKIAIHPAIFSERVCVHRCRGAPLCYMLKPHERDDARSSPRCRLPRRGTY